MRDRIFSEIPEDWRIAYEAEQLQAMAISCEAAIIFATRHAELAESLATREDQPARREELKQNGTGTGIKKNGRIENGPLPGNITL